MSSKPRISGIDSVSTGDRQTPKRSQRQHRSHHKYSDIDVDEGETVAEDTNVDRVTTPLKLTIKIGGQTLGEKSVNKSSIRALSSTPNTSANVAPNEDQLELSMSFDDEEDDEEEEADDSVRSDGVVSEPVDDDEWLDALEEGRGLHEVDDELKRIRDPKLMTARQVFTPFV
ncbi:unnamed protein product [Oppiella nova]|uniref:Uncharacterized protein n=1 Tax=Oppiella nova TaxID=334625 RepID=A0A7R9MSJ8_9ACAR|nr:unnamed protein product [Oppiella nova]CAG2182550.1 unnamed protein product [Oppiella nova]